DDRSLPIIIATNQGARTIVQFQGRILQRIGNTVLTKLRANGADDHSLGLRALDDKSSDHHVVTYLHKGAGTDVAKDRISVRDQVGLGTEIVHFHKSNSDGAVYTAHDRRVVARWRVVHNR